MDEEETKKPKLTVTPASTTQALSSGDRPPSSSSSPQDPSSVQSLLDQFDPLSVSEKKGDPKGSPEPKADADGDHSGSGDADADAELNGTGDTDGDDGSGENTKLDHEIKSEKPGKNKANDDPQTYNPNENENESRPFDFQRFLNQLRHKSADPIARYLKSFLSEFGKRNWTANEQVKIINDFKAFINGKMDHCEPFASLPDQERDNVLEGMEKLIMNRLYGQTFSPEIPHNKRSDDHEEDIIRDKVLEEKMHIWHWIQGRHLDLADRFLRNGEAFVKLASDELLKINHYRAPRDKIICILNCCKVIFGLLRQTNSEESADGFLPILIYVVIKAQPYDFISNVNYIQRFRNPDKLGGEAGYYLSSLIGAISFVETLDRTGLSITDEEFEKNVEHSVKSIAPKNLGTSLASQQQPPNTPGSSPRRSPAQGAQDAQDGPGGSQTRPVPPDQDQEQQKEPRKQPASTLNASTVLANSAGLFSAPLRSLGKFFESDGDDESNATESEDSAASSSGSTPRKRTASGVTPQESAARQVSAEEEEARRIHEQEFESVCETLCQMFPGLDREVIRDVLREKQGRVGAAVDACLALVG